MTPNELMDYVKSTIEVPGGRITEGSMSIQDNTVKLSDITIQTPIGKAVVSGNLVDDATQGLRLDQQSLDTKLDFLCEPKEEKSKRQLIRLPITSKRILMKKSRIPTGNQA